MRKKMKVFLCAVLAGVMIISTGITASAIEFNVTVGGSGYQDPLSKRVIKNGGDAYDNFAYFRGTTMSNALAVVAVRSIRLNNINLSSISDTHITSSNLGSRFGKAYNAPAPAGVYYYMKSESKVRTNLTGYYTP